MGPRSGALGFAVVLAISSVHAEPWQLGQALSTEFLVSLAQQEVGQSGIAIINEPVSSMMIFDRKSAGSVVFISGSGGSFLWSQIAKQISVATAREERIHVVIDRSLVVEKSCPKLQRASKAFLENLDDVLNHIKVVSASTGSEITVDGPVFRIVMQGKDALITVAPDSVFDPPLQRATGELHSIVSGCSNSVTPEVEEHDF
jgi:hypothetical protein